MTISSIKAKISVDCAIEIRLLFIDDTLIITLKIVEFYKSGLDYNILQGKDISTDVKFFICTNKYSKTIKSNEKEISCLFRVCSPVSPSCQCLYSNWLSDKTVKKESGNQHAYHLNKCKYMYHIYYCCDIYEKAASLRFVIIAQ